MSLFIDFADCWGVESNGCLDELNVVAKEAPGKVKLGALDGFMTAEELHTMRILQQIHQNRLVYWMV